MNNVVAVPVETLSRARMTVETIDRVHDFASLRSEWNGLLQASAADCPFLTWEWMYSWWIHLHGASKVWILAVRAGDCLVGLAPFRISAGALPWFSKIEFLATGFAGSDYLDLIVRRGFEAETLEAIATTLKSQRVAVRLTHLPQRSFGADLTMQLAGADWDVRTRPSGVCPFIRLDGHSWDSYLVSRGSSHRANFRRRLRTLDRTFEMRFEPISSERERVDALEALAQFHKARWHKQGGSTAFQTNRLCEFHKDVMHNAQERDWLRLYVLRLNGGVAAVMYAFAYNRRFYFYQHGFDENYRDYSIGLVLMGLTIRAAIEEGATEFDMLYGTESYKRLWADGERSLQAVDSFPSHFGGRLHSRRVQAESTLRSLVRRLFLKEAHAA